MATGSRAQPPHRWGRDDVMTEAWVEECIRAGRPPTGDTLDDVLASEAPRLGEQGSAAAGAQLRASYLGLGPLATVAGEVGVTDVLVNGHGDVWVDRGNGVVPHPEVGLSGSEEVRRLAVRLATLSGRRLDEGQPWVDGLLPSGVRLHAILPPLVEHGPHISLRIPRREALSLELLVGTGMVSEADHQVLRSLVRDRVAFVVSGGTGTGKTTLLGALLAEVPERERLLVVEDVRELVVRHPHVIRLQARPANVEGVGEVAMVDLLRQALRMRPDRLVVGEVRGGEVRELLAALNTGHDGGCGTIHANHPRDVPARFEALGALAGMSPAAVRAQLASAIQVVIHLARDGSGRRHVAAVETLTPGRAVGS